MTNSLVNRFLEYVKIDTTSMENSLTYPSTENQVVLLEKLAKELIDLGLQVDFDKKYVIARLPKVDSATTIAYIAHVDTSNAVSGKDVKPIITPNYQGGDIVLPYITVPAGDLSSYIGKTIITSDGSTLLGTDDKAGVAEIMEVAEYLMKNPDKKRCNLVIVFTPDEEIGRGTDYLDVAKVGADFGYTVDGGKLGCMEYENFNACGFNLTINGISVHPGSGKGVLKNAIDLFAEFHAMLPENERPVSTCEYEGFYMVNSVKGGVENLTANYLIRDFDKNNFENRKEHIIKCLDLLNKKYGKGTFVGELKDSYYNMKEEIVKNPKIIELANKSFYDCGVKPNSSPIRGGTDGSKLSFMGLPCPNLSYGGANAHSRKEYAVVEDMEKMVEILIKITENFA